MILSKLIALIVENICTEAETEKHHHPENTHGKLDQKEPRSRHWYRFTLLVAGFFLLQGKPSYLLDPPGHDFLVAAHRYDAQQPKNYGLSFEIREGRLQGKATLIGEGDHYTNRQNISLFRYRAASNEFVEIPWETPEALDELDGVLRFTVSETANLKLDKSARSPDGYLFEYSGYRGQGGLLGELFGRGRRYDRQFVLEKDGAYFRLPSLRAQPHYYGNNIHFLGWVLVEETSS